MASNTENLNLLMKNPSTDGADTFNVQTMLNENWQKIDENAGTVAQTLANILKPTTPPIIGLPPSTTPDGMFQALGNTGELHVWRKTVTTAQEIPAGYTLGDAQSIRLVLFAASSGVTVRYADSISVNDGGAASLKNSSEISLQSSSAVNTLNSNCKGKFVEFSATGMNKVSVSGIVYIQANSVFSEPDNYIYASNAQLVNAYPLTPAGTTTTYPVSTNPKAYQEGDDAKAAGYVVGEVVTGDFILGQANAADADLFYKTSSPTVSDDGTIEFDKNQYIKIGYAENWTASTLQAAIRGQFLQRGNYMNPPSNHVPAGTIYIPNDAVVTRSNDNYIVSKYQPVTGYAAIPAGTTIEYLGKLGDKARVQVVSYVGTGRSGADNPNSLTFDFVPKLLLIKGDVKSAYYICLTLFGTTLTGTYETYSFFDVSGNMNYPDSSYARKNGKNIQWYSLRNAYVQANGSGLKYTAIAIG